MTKNSHANTRIVTSIIFILSIISLFFILPVYAAADPDIDVYTYVPSKDFSVNSALDKVSVCSCSTKFDVISIQNTGTFNAIYTISANAQFEDRILLSENNFELAPGESRDITITFLADCTESRNELVLTVTSSLGVQKSITKEVAYERCQNLQMWVGSDNITPLACSPLNAQVYIRNVGTFSDTYIITSNKDDKIIYSANNIVLLPGQIAQVNATIKLDCGKIGKQDVRFTANAIANKLESSITYSYTVQPNYGYDVSINNELQSNHSYFMDVCNRIQTRIPVAIRNNGIANNFTLDFDLPGFISIEGAASERVRIEIGAGETRTLYLLVDSRKFRNEVNDYDIRIDIEPRYGDPRSLLLGIHLKDCYEHQVIISAPEENDEDNPEKTCAGYLYPYDIIIKNNGLFAESFDLSLEGNPASVEISPRRIVVQPGEEARAKLLVTGPQTSYYYDIAVSATLINGLQESDNIWIKAYTNEECHNVVLSDSHFRINYDAQRITVQARKTGIGGGEYDLEWNGSDILTLETERLNLENAQPQNIVFDVDAEGLNEGTYAGNLIITHTQSKTQYTKDIVVRLKDKSFIAKGIGFLMGSACRQVSLYQVILAILLIGLIIYFVLKGPHYPYKLSNRIKSKLNIIFILLAVFVVVAILVVLLAGLPKGQGEIYNLTQNTSQLYFEIVENDQFTIDAAQFFEDPDNNIVRYEVSQMENVDVTIEDSKVTLYPGFGWSGTEMFTITAYDSQGASVESPEMTLRVIEKRRYSVAQLYSIYCWYVNLVIFLLLLVLVFAAVIVKQKKRTRK